MKFNKLADIFPLLPNDELEKLAEDIKQNGLLTPIITLDNTILDGRNRYLACKKVGVKPVFEEYRGSDPLSFVLSTNLHRRHLTKSQLAVLALDIEKVLAEKGRDRKKLAGKVYGKGKQIAFCINAESYSPIHASKEAGEYVGVGERYVHYAKKIRDNDPELFAAVSDGSISITKALSKMKSKEISERIRKTKEVNLAGEYKGIVKPKLHTTSYDRFNINEFDLLLTDPPYSTDIENISMFVKEWLDKVLPKLKDTGRGFICIGAYPEEINAYISYLLSTEWILDSPLIWTYRNTLGKVPKMRYNLNYQMILHIYKKTSKPLDTSIINEMFSVQDINAPDGRHGNRYFKWQKPSELARRLITHTTNTGDVIYDPFAGSGTFILEASKLGRVGVGCELDLNTAKIAKERGCELAK